MPLRLFLRSSLTCSSAATFPVMPFRALQKHFARNFRCPIAHNSTRLQASFGFCVGGFGSKHHMKLQQPLNYDFRVSQLNLPDPKGVTTVITTSPPGHHREAKIALATTAKLQQLLANNREMATCAESCNDRKMRPP